MNSKTLIIRFSSFGDIVQTMSCIPQLAASGEVHFLTKKSFAALPSLCADVTEVHSFDPKTGLMGLIKMSWGLRKYNFSLVYDAHQNPRSKIARFLITIFSSTRLIVRSKERIKRILFFKFNKRDVFTFPYKGMESFCSPLELIPKQQKWNFEKLISSDRRQELDKFKDQIVLVPSAAWEMKRWPINNWASAIKDLKTESVILGGPEDAFCEELAKCSNLCVNLAGKLSLVESCYVISNSKLVISADTGLLHVADLLGIQVIALLGPTAFGYPSFSNSHELSVELSCRPCSKDGRGGCSQSVWQRCMVEITPTMLLKKIDQLLA